jgi:hypothetical protein
MVAFTWGDAQRVVRTVRRVLAMTHGAAARADVAARILQRFEGVCGSNKRSRVPVSG